MFVKFDKCYEMLYIFSGSFYSKVYQSYITRGKILNRENHSGNKTDI